MSSAANDIDTKDAASYTIEYNGGRTGEVVAWPDEHVVLYGGADHSHPTQSWSRVAQLWPGFGSEQYFSRSTQRWQDDGRVHYRGTVLLHLSDLQYVLIMNDTWVQFEALALITEFHSPVRGSAVPYPYAMDGQSTAYLMDGQHVGFIRNYQPSAEYIHPDDWLDDHPGQAGSIVGRVGRMEKSRGD